MVAISTSRTPQTLFDENLRSKQASMAAQCYILCIKLMVSLSEQMLQSLLASPLPTPRSAFANLSTSEATQNAKRARSTRGNPFQHESHPRESQTGRFVFSSNRQSWSCDQFHHQHVPNWQQATWQDGTIAWDTSRARRWEYVVRNCNRAGEARSAFETVLASSLRHVNMGG